MPKVGDSSSPISDMSGCGSSSVTSSSPEVEYTKPPCHHMNVLRFPLDASSNTAVEYPPRIPVALRHPRLVASVKQYRSEAQQQQLQHFIVSESFIPVAPDTVKPPRKRRRPPFSYSSLIAQAILGSEDERMTLQEIYKWIMDKYPALYDANDTGWQNTIRHNLSLNNCFKKIPKVQMDGLGPHGKGGYWTVDPSYLAKYKNGSFARGMSSTTRRKEPREIRMKVSEDQQQPLPKLPSLSRLTTQSQPPHQPPSLATTCNMSPSKYIQSPIIPSSTPSLPFSSSSSSSSPPPYRPKRPSSSSSSQVMQIRNLLN